MENKQKPHKRRSARLWIILGVVVAMLASFISCSVIANADTGTVKSITDGDTLVISVGGANKTIRLLNVDTPETKDPAKDVECLGPEATEFLTQTLPAGTKVKLKYDVERKDKYGRTLAAVFTKDGTLVNAEIARAGLGTALVVGRNSAFLEQVKAAQEQAKAAQKGLFGSDIACTLPAQVQAATTALTEATAGPAAATSTDAAAAIATASAAIVSAKALQSALTVANMAENALLWSAYTSAELSARLALLTSDIGRAETFVKSLTETKSKLEASEAKAAAEKKAAEVRAAEEKKAAAAKAAAEKAAQEAAKKAAAEAAAQAAAQAAAEAAAAAEAERIRNLPPVYVPPAPPAYQPPVYEPPAQNQGGGGSPGYTGPRCYAPGGKTWRPC
ncbi:thermonuclease family protein [Arthrobacter sp. A2-55]|uniref:thermonuclease family protein n=1 Tax=Arthrobacter sp. A2-55 TaxID=2897337 RepID=UPI0021CD4C14|nr:thermonuclease family protein [Arthrobacter sp. A2-55]MCU6481988.1 thermonuclease family protein [Arthrobacter sp. A2-55]